MGVGISIVIKAEGATNVMSQIHLSTVTLPKIYNVISTFLQNFHFWLGDSFIRPSSELETNCKRFLIKIYLKQSLILEFCGKCFQSLREIVRNSLGFAGNFTLYMIKYHNILINSFKVFNFVHGPNLQNYFFPTKG